MPDERVATTDVGEYLDKFLSLLPAGDVLVADPAGSLWPVARAIARRGRYVSYLDPRSHDIGGATRIVRRRLSAADPPLPAGSFAGGWTTPETAAGLVDLLVPSGVLADGVDLATAPDPGRAGEPASEPDCLFCPQLRFQFNTVAQLPGAAGALWGDHEVFVICDVAPLVEGHLLIVTTDHYLCMGQCPPRLWPALNQARAKAARLLRLAYGGAVSLFEHGPARANHAGACIDHAHWHVLPAEVDVTAAARRYGLAAISAELPTLHELNQAGQSYVYIDSGSGGTAYLAGELPAQFMRLAVGSSLAGDDGAPDDGAPDDNGPDDGAGTWRWQQRLAWSGNRERFLAALRRLTPLADGGLPLPG